MSHAAVYLKPLLWRKVIAVDSSAQQHAWWQCIRRVCREAAEAVAAQASAKVPIIRTFDEYTSRKEQARAVAKVKPEPPSGGSAGGGGGGGAPKDSSGPGVAALRDYVGKLLKAAHVEGRITGSQFREVRDKVVAKVSCHSMSCFLC
jgi:hypothetical protein